MDPAASGIARARFRWRLVALLCLAGLIALFTYLAVRASRQDAVLNTTLPWRPFQTSDRPTTIVMGDYYLFAQLPGPGDKAQEPQLIWDRAVPTREDMTIYHILNPETANTVADYNQQYVTSGTIEAIADLKSALQRDPALRQKAVQVIAASQLTPEILKTSDIIYVGQVSGMSALLRDPLLQASGFKVDASLNGLIDAAPGTHYQSDGMVLTDERISRRDYGYFASLPGPAGNSILIIASLRDPGLKEMAELATDPVRLSELKSDDARKRGFEALYRVRTMKNVNLSAALVIDRPLKPQGIWDRSGIAPEYRPIESVRSPEPAD